ncbi:MAG: NAD(P)/FAD-dependent oxidoreductase [Armatimonadota bacterium]
MDTFKYLLLGGGMSAGYAAKEFVTQGIEAGELCIVSMDQHPPYQRPPLSKSYLAGEDSEEDILINPRSFYDENGIDLRLKTRVTSVDLDERTATTASDVSIGYEILIIATGSWVRYLDIPGSDLDGVLYLRDMEMSDAIRDAAQNADRAVVVGGGFIGTEIAAYLAQTDTKTTLAYRQDRLIATFFTEEMSRAYEDAFTDHDVELIAGADVAGFEGDGVVSAVRLADGSSIPADMVVCGVGAVQEVGLFEDTDIEADGLIPVDEYLRTARPNVYACGDVARIYDPYFDKDRHIEHEDNARRSGKHVARMVMGDQDPYDYLPYFWSEVFDFSWELWGDTAEADHVFHRKAQRDEDMVVIWTKGNRVVAAWGPWTMPKDDKKLLQQWIKSGEAVDVEKLADETTSIADLQ